MLTAKRNKLFVIGTLLGFLLFGIIPYIRGQSNPKFKVIAFYNASYDLGHISFAHEANGWFANLAQKYNFQYDSTKNWDNLNANFLSNYQVVMFFDDKPATASQRNAFQQYMQNGGGFIGFHVCAFNTNPSEWDWYYNQFLATGAFRTNTWGPSSAVIKVEDNTHPATVGMPSKFTSAVSEWYGWMNDLRTNPNIRILCSVDPSSFPLGTDPNQSWYSGYYPLVWTNKNYKMLYANFGHNDIDYAHNNATKSYTFSNPTQNNLIINSLLWMGGDAAPVYSLPGMVQAEGYDVMNGVKKETTTDAGGGQDIGYIDAGDWLDYKVDVKNSGSYKVQYRVASMNGNGTIQLKSGNTLLTTTTVPATSGWQSWTTITTTITLSAGQQTLRLQAGVGGYNINWVNFSYDGITNTPPAVTLTAPNPNDPFTSPATINIAANASDSDGSISKVGFYNGSTLVGTSTSAPYNFAWTNVPAGTYSITAKATDDKGATTSSAPVTVNVTNPIVQTPYGGTPWTIPGKIEAENYDLGGEGIAYHDATTANQGSAYRQEAVDIETATEGGYNVGWTVNGEWLEYTVNVSAAGSYKLEARVAAMAAGSSFHMEMDGQNISGSIAVPNTTGWQTWQTASVTTSALTAGQKVMRVVIDAGSFNLNNVTFSAIVPNTPPVVTITSPANNSSYSSGSTISINANAIDADGSVSKVEFYNGSTLLGTDNTSPYSFAWANVIAGTYSLTAKATDNNGASTTSSAVAITVNPVFNCNQVIWSDEFNGTSVDQTKWIYQTGDGCNINLCGWGNNELEYYTNSTNNVNVTGGNLEITARYQPNYNGTGKNYTSGKLISSGKYSHKYGKFEARIKIPSAAGIWPAFWLLPDGGGWPQNGEIDILETVNKNSNWYGTLHYASTSGSHLSSGNSFTPPSDLGNDFHIYAADWTTDYITFYVDGVNRGTVTKASVQSKGGVWPFDSHNFYILLNVAVGGNWPGAPNSSQYPVSMVVDYVRVYDNSPCTVTESPYGGVVRNIPGKIEAEDYDLGGEGVAYHDNDMSNNGTQYRTDAVDIEACTDAGAGYDVGWTNAGEFLKYMVNVTTTGTFNLDLRIASNTTGGSFHVELDGQNISGATSVPNTGGWQNWQTVRVTTSSLTAGQKVMRVVIDTGNFNLNNLTFTSITNVSNIPPVISITDPVNNSSYTSGSTITLTANASDTDGSVSKVEFYNGSTLLGTDNTSPYSFTWANVAAGTYSLTAKATDNSGEVTTSVAVTIIVKTVTSNPCTDIAQYVENGGYVEGSKVQNAGSIYQCKPYPYSGWCNGAAWAYAPGAGSYWTDAWVKLGSCTAKMAQTFDANTTSMITLLPNPTSGSVQVKLNVGDIPNADYSVINSLGVEVLNGNLNSDLEASIDLTGLKNGIYTIRIHSSDNSWMNKIVKQ
jgi:beta-glucanase (GH16 family)